MDITLGDVQTTALIPLAIKANETMRKKPRIKDEKAVEIIKALGIDTKPYDKFISHEGVVARTIMLDKQLKNLIKKIPMHVLLILVQDLIIDFLELIMEKCIRAKIFAKCFPTFNNRWATFEW